MTIRTLIVDDEPLARRGLELRLRDAPDIEIVRQCANGREALAAINELAPDLMLLDIQMPGMSGLDMLAQVPRESMPMVVFVTAFDRFAIQAFEARALDYLLKPVDDERLRQALERVRAEWQQRVDNNRYVTRMRAELGELAAIPNVIPVAATFVPFDGAGFLDPEDIARAIRPNTRLVVVNHASNVIGTVRPWARR